MTIVSLERCIFRTKSVESYRQFVERNASSSILSVLLDRWPELQLGAELAGGKGDAEDHWIPLTVVDLTPATAGRLSETTTIIVLPPATDLTHGSGIGTNNNLSDHTITKSLTGDNAVGEEEEEKTFISDEVYDDVCLVVLDETLTADAAVASRDFFSRLLLLPSSIVLVGDEEYATAVAVGEDPYAVSTAAVLTLRSGSDVFRNIRAAALLEPLPVVVAPCKTYAERQLRVPFALFRQATVTAKEAVLTRAVLAPGWPPFMTAAVLGEGHETLLALALRAAKALLDGRLIAVGDVLALPVAPRLMQLGQVPYDDAMESQLARAADLATSGNASTASHCRYHYTIPTSTTLASTTSTIHGGMEAVVIPLRVVEASGHNAMPFGRLELLLENGHTTEVSLLPTVSSNMFRDATPFFAPLPPLHAFHARLSLTAAVRSALGDCYAPNHSIPILTVTNNHNNDNDDDDALVKSETAAERHVFVVHAVRENMPCACVAAAVGESGVRCAVVDLDRREDADMQRLVEEHAASGGGIALVVRNAQLLPERPQVLQLFDDAPRHGGLCTSAAPRVVFLVCESMEAVPPTVAARAGNACGVVRGTNPSESDRQHIAECLFASASGAFGLRRSLLLSFESIAAWTVGLSAADVVAFMHDSLAAARGLGMALGPDVSPVLSETHCAAVLQRFQRAHGHNLVSTRLQPVRWGDVGGLEEAKRELRETIQLPLLHPELFRGGTKRRAGILFYGPPGCGKTLLAKAVATEMNMNFMAVKGPELINQYVGESERNIRLLFQRARDNSPCIVFFDELDALAPQRGAKGDAGGAMDRVVAQLLVEVDGVGQTRSDGTAASQVFVIGATNRPDLLDASLLRPGRFDRLCYLGIPSTRSEQLFALRALTRKFDMAGDVNFEALLQPLDFQYTGADFFALCSDAMMFAVEEMLEEAKARVMEGKPNDNASEREETPKLTVKMSHFVKARNQLKPSVTVDDLKRYEALKTKFST